MSRKKSKKLWHLKKTHLPQNIKWLHDMDYLHTLNPEEQAWMNKFIKEYYDGNVKKGDYDALHCDDESRRECYNRKNRQNRDTMSILDANGKMDRTNGDKDQS